MEFLAFYGIAIEPIKVQTQSASQNDRLNISFVEDKHVNGFFLGSLPNLHGALFYI